MPNLRKLFKEVKRAGTGGKISSVGIEFGSSSIKLVKLVENKGVISLDNYGSIALGPFVDKASGEVANLDSAKMQSAWSQLLNNMGIDVPDAIAVAIPLSATLVVPLEIELSQSQDLESVVMEKIKDQIPVPLTNVYVDWQEVHADQIDAQNREVPSAPSNNQNKDKDQEIKTWHKVICYVINKDVIQNYVNVLVAMDQEIDYFELEIYSVIRSALSPGMKSALVLDIGAKYTKMYAIKNGEVQQVNKKLHGGVDYTRVFADQLKADFDVAEDIKRSIVIDDIPNEDIKSGLLEMIEQIGNSVKSLRDDAGLDADIPVYLCGAGVLLDGLPGKLSKKLDTKVIICQPFKNIQAPDYLNQILSNTGPEYTVATGLALKHLRVI